MIRRNLRISSEQDVDILKELQMMALNDPIMQSCLHIFRNCDIKTILINCVRALQDHNKELKKSNLDKMIYRAEPCQTLIPFKEEELKPFLEGPKEK